jgi:ParB family chromosome partitioning protein
MPKKSGLGRGLDALIPSSQGMADESAFLPTGGVSQIRTVDIRPNPRQPRTRFDPTELAELAESIRAHGIIQPLIVTQAPEAGQFTLIAGERRLLAARQAGLEEVPAIVREASQQEQVELALVENVQRADLSPLEAAEAYRQLAEDFGLSHEAIASRVGKKRVSVTNTLRLLKLPSVVQQALAEGRISEGHARALLALPTSQAQAAALEILLKRQLNVRQTEELVRLLCGERPPRPTRASLPPELADLEDRLRTSLGTRVALKPRGQGGTLVIHFFSAEELNQLAERLIGDADPV